jgi:hypothetical protein
MTTRRSSTAMSLKSLPLHPQRVKTLRLPLRRIRPQLPLQLRPLPLRQQSLTLSLLKWQL